MVRVQPGGWVRLAPGSGSTRGAGSAGGPGSGSLNTIEDRWVRVPVCAGSGAGPIIVRASNGKLALVLSLFLF